MGHNVPKMAKLTLLFSFGLISACVGQVIQNDPCVENIEVIQNFDPNQYAGTWYDIESLDTRTGTCQVHTWASAGQTINVRNSEVEAGELRSETGTAPQALDAKYTVTFNSGTSAARESQYWILDTDYTTFSLVYSCRTIGSGDSATREVQLWKLGRNTGALPGPALERIRIAIERTNLLNVIESDKFFERKHAADDCRVSVIVPACPTVNAANNFNIDNFVGNWNEVSRLRDAAETGQCNNVRFVRDGNFIRVENTEINNEFMDTLSGTAPVPTTGLLDITYSENDDSRTVQLYVLATDNDNYALVYSCDTKTEESVTTRRVNSGILRKTNRVLTEQENAAINNAITATGFDRVHFQETHQSDDKCFYYPEYPDGLPDIIELRGECPTTITGQSNFNIQNFLGKWYEVARYPHTSQTGQCNGVEYGQLGTTGSFTVQNTKIENEALTTTSVNGRTTDQNGVLIVDLDIGGVPTPTYIYVLATDHNNYALGYSCESVGPVGQRRRRVRSWKLSRSPSPLSADHNAAINEVIRTTQGLHEPYYQETLQTDAACFYYPVYSDGLPEAIELRGECPTTITGYEGFNLQNFLGTWYEVARYPHSLQTGQCNSATYAAPSAGLYTVENTEVKNEALTTVLSDFREINQNGELEILLSIEGVITPINVRVLATDHNNYALLYSCESVGPVGQRRRRVRSWKLSKSPSPLSAEHNAAINEVIRTTQGLHEPYYQETLQTDAACFYYPEYSNGLPEAIELRGECPDTITGVNNFDLGRFIGLWYEVARYPQPRQTGHCSRTEFNTVDSQTTIVNSQVASQLLTTMSGQVRHIGTSGILEVTLEGHAEPTQLHVLATDYDNYALLYSCRSLAVDGQRRRQVGSWKLSRDTSPLVEEAIVAIDNAVKDTEGLIEDYYQITNQNNEACFHYPVQTGDNVVIPGQCDISFTGMANIDLSKFTNEEVWYQIQRYDKVEGSCIGTRLKEESDSITLNHLERVGDEVKRLRGEAWLSSASTGNFTINMDDSEEPITIFILDTDYENYAIAYNCKNLENNQRQIGAWVLSRERTMPEEGTAAINLLYERRDEFTNRDGYFKQISHTYPAGNECPEPSSAFIIKSSIIVIFVCAVLQLVW